MALEGLYRILLSNKHAISQKATARIEDLVAEYIPDPSNLTCPSPAELERLIRIRENIYEPLVGLNKRIEPVSKFIEKIPPIITALKIVVNILKIYPPTQFAATQASKIIDKYGDEVIVATIVINSIIDSLEKVLEELKQLEELINKCAEEGIANSPEIAAVLASVTKLTQETPREALYRDHEIKVNSEQVGQLTRNYVEAINPKGERVYIGDKSFSSSIQVLINEAKFEVDKLLQ